MPTNDRASVALAGIEAKIRLVKEQMHELANKPITDATAAGFATFERAMLDLARRLAALQTALHLQLMIATQFLTEAVHDLVANLRGKYRNLGWRMVTVTFLGGVRVAIAAPYFARSAGRAIAKGIYPHFIALGLVDKATPALASTVAQYAAAMSSFAEARAMLAGQGIALDVKTVRRIATAFAERARIGQRMSASPVPDAQRKDGKPRSLIVVSTDGGRIRVRRKKRGQRGRRKRCGYHADWREPKLVIIYVVDEAGRLDARIPPVIDATLAGPDAAFDLLAYYLERLKISPKDEVAFIADGARWIWDRLARLCAKVKLARARVVELLDFYHVAQHVFAIAAMKRSWTARRRRQWARKIRKWLRGGKQSEAIDEIRRVTAGTHNQLMKRERGYFERNAGRLGFAAMQKRKRPIGSGAVESAIRRVINLRLKGPGIMWLESTAEQMLFLRCYYKAGRWRELEQWASHPQAAAM